MPTSLMAIANKARKSRKHRFQNLYHHLNTVNLRTCFYELKKNAAPGVDKVGWQTYETNLEETCKTLTPVSEPVLTMPDPSVGNTSQKATESSAHSEFSVSKTRSFSGLSPISSMQSMSRTFWTAAMAIVLKEAPSAHPQIWRGSFNSGLMAGL